MKKTDKILTWLAVAYFFLFLIVASYIASSYATERTIPKPSRSVMMTSLNLNCNDYKKHYQTNQVKKCELQKRDSARKTFEFKSSILVHPVRRR